MCTKSSPILIEFWRHYRLDLICGHKSRMCISSLNGLEESPLSGSGMWFYVPAYFFLKYKAAYPYFKITRGSQCSGGIRSRKQGRSGFLPRSPYFVHNLHNSMWLYNPNCVALRYSKSWCITFSSLFQEHYLGRLWASHLGAPQFVGAILLFFCHR